MPEDAAATKWVDGLQVSGAEILANYVHPHLGRWPATTSKSHRLGRITYVGTMPNPSMARALFDWIGAARAVRTWADLPDSVTATSGIGRSGRRVHFVRHRGWGETVVSVPLALRDVFTENTFVVGDQLLLHAWDVKVLIEI